MAKTVVTANTSTAVVVVWATLMSQVCYFQQGGGIETVSNKPSCKVAPDFGYETLTNTETAGWVKFQTLSREWRQQRGAMSSITAMCMLRPYQKIIGMGLDALPFILAELKSEGDDPDQWFWALTTIAEANNLIPPQIDAALQGDYHAMAQAWLGWERQHFYAG